MALSTNGEGKSIESFVGDLEQASGFQSSFEKGREEFTSKFGSNL